jgi:hypothetical protein
MSVILYWVFLICGVGQMFLFAAPMVVAAVIPNMVVVALFAGWLVIAASAVALYRARAAAWLALLGAAPALVMATRAVVARESGYALLFGVPSIITVTFAARWIARGAIVHRAPFRPDMSPATKRLLLALPLGLFLIQIGGWVLR